MRIRKKNERAKKMIEVLSFEREKIIEYNKRYQNLATSKLKEEITTILNNIKHC